MGIRNNDGKSSFQDKIEYTPDASPDAWEHYRRVYKPEDWIDYNFNDIHFFVWIPEGYKKPFLQYN